MLIMIWKLLDTSKNVAYIREAHDPSDNPIRSVSTDVGGRCCGSVDC